MIWLICGIALLAFGFWSLLPKRSSRLRRSGGDLDGINATVGGGEGPGPSGHSFDHGHADGGHGGGGADGGVGH